MQNSITDAIQRAFLDLWGDVINIIPELVAALAVFVVGLIVASIAGSITRKIVKMLRVDTLADRMNVHDTLQKVGLNFTFSDALGTIVKWFFIIVFLSAAVEILGWTEIIAFLNSVLWYIPRVIVAVIILAIGLIAASFVENAVVRGLKSARTPVKSPETLGSLAKWAVVGFTLMASLSQLRIAEDLIAILFAGILAVFVISFGLAGKEKAAKFLDQVL